LKGARICDLCCGEGYVGRRLLAHGAGEVVGIDRSSALIEVAKRRANAPGLSYRVDDAQAPRSVADAEFDAVVCYMAMMDVADHKALFASVRRVLAPGRPFVCSLLHPCFMPPCHATQAPPLILDGAGLPIASRCNATPPKDIGIPAATASEAEWAPTTASSPPTSTIFSPAALHWIGWKSRWRAATQPLGWLPKCPPSS
jgi:SAM-dependent methyltransferase